eukprot:403365981
MGYHATLFAYGQTGSGKTYTMEGYEYQQKNQKSNIYVPIVNPRNDDNLGMVPRIISDMFIQANQKSEQKHITLFCSFLQIYNEKVLDLLNDSHSSSKASLKENPGLRIRWSKQDQFQVENLYIFECENEQQMMELYHYGIRNRVIASHNLNQTSSRSHCIFTITVESINKQNIKEIAVSKLQLVDLAGSEKSDQTGITQGKKQHHKESIQINKSLFALRKVIKALSNQSNPVIAQNGDGQVAQAQNNNFIPYRDSKLTSLLKQSLGGSSFTIMIACLSPSDLYFDENMSTLKYANQASKIKNKPVQNIDEKILMIRNLKEQVRQLQFELKNANEHIEFLSNVNNLEPMRFGVDMINTDLQDNQKLQMQDIVRKAIAEEEKPYKSNSIKNIQIEPSPKNSNNHLETFLNKLGIDMNNSINKVTELLKSNNQLRDNLDKIQIDKEELEQKLLSSNIENERLMQKIEQYDRIKASQGIPLETNSKTEHKYINQVSSVHSSIHLPKINTAYSFQAFGKISSLSQKTASTPVTQQDDTFSQFNGQLDSSQPTIYSPIYNMKDEKAFEDLNRKVKELEKRNQLLEKQNHSLLQELNFVGNNEPVRPQFQMQDSQRSNKILPNFGSTTSTQKGMKYSKSSAMIGDPNINSPQKKRVAHRVSNTGHKTNIDEPSGLALYKNHRQTSSIRNLLQNEQFILTQKTQKKGSESFKQQTTNTGQQMAKAYLQIKH